MAAKPIAERSGSVTPAAAPEDLGAPHDAKEALFKKFIEWQRNSASQGLNP
jgi:hypothetical protein